MTIRIEHEGETLTIAQWARVAKMSKRGFEDRLKRMTMAEAIIPLRTHYSSANLRPKKSTKPHTYVPTAEERREMELCAFNRHPALGVNPFPLRGSLCA